MSCRYEYEQLYWILDTTNALDVKYDEWAPDSLTMSHDFTGDIQILEPSTLLSHY